MSAYRRSQDRLPRGCSSARGPAEQTLPCSNSLNQFAKFLARFEEGNLLRRHFDSGSSLWIPSDAPSSLACMESSESADFNLVAGSQRTDDAVKYGADDNVGFLPGHLNGVANLVGQIGPGHLARPHRITKKSITVFLGAPDYWNAAWPQRQREFNAVNGRCRRTHGGAFA